MTTKISADNLKADIAITTTGDIDVSSGTLTLANDQISGDKISGGTISTFTSTGIDDNATSTAITIDSSQNVGINVTNPGSFYSGSNNLVVKDGISIFDTTDSRLEFVDGTSGSEAYVGNIVYNHTSDFMRFNVNVSERMRIDSSGNVGIGTSSPEEKLDFGDGQLQNLKIGLRTYLGTGYSTAGTIFGHSVKAKNSITDGAASMEVTETNSGGGAPSAIRMQYGQIEFHTASSGTANALFDSERMRIDSSGNLMVGKTSTSLNDAGFSVLGGSNAGILQLRRDIATANSSSVGYISRGTSDGNILTFYKNNSSVGSIGVAGSNPFLANVNSRGISLGSNLVPCNSSGTAVDNLSDLGISSARFKDLYLGNSIDLNKSTNQTQVNIRSSVTPDGTKIGGQINLSLGSGSNSGSGNTSTQVGDTLGQIVFNGQGTDYGFQGGSIEVKQTTPNGQTNRTDAGCDMIFGVIGAGNTGYSEKLRIKSTGGITFNGETSVNNALDDYEEGTWTPTAVSTGDWSGFASSTVTTYMAQYTKVGRKVSIQAQIVFPDSGSSALAAGDSVRIGGLPFNYGGSGDNIYSKIPSQIFARDSTNGGVCHNNLFSSNNITLRVVATHGSGARYQQGLNLSFTYFTD